MKPRDASRLVSVVFLFKPLMFGDSPEPMYGRDIRPILQKRCIGCHHVTGIREAWFTHSLSLVSYKGLMDGGIRGRIVIPGNADGSLLVRAIIPFSEGGLRDADNSGPSRPYMPFRAEKLSREEVDTIRRWINSGAHAEPEWEDEETAMTLQDVSVSNKRGGVYCLPHFVGSDIGKLRVRVVARNPERTLSVDWNGHANAGEWTEWGIDGTTDGEDRVRGWPSRADIELNVLAIFPAGTIFVFNPDGVPPARLENHKKYTKFEPNPIYPDRAQGVFAFWLDEPSDVTLTVQEETKAGPKVIYRRDLRDLGQGVNRHAWNFGASLKSGIGYGYYTARFSCTSRSSKLQEDILLSVVVVRL